MTQDPRKYFRIEASDIVDRLTQAFMLMREGSSPPGGIRELLRLSHTLKGAAHVVKESDIASAAHQMESQLAAYVEADILPADELSRLLIQLDELAQKVAAAGATPVEADDEDPDVAPPSTPALISDDVLRTVRVDVDEMDQVVHGVSESIVKLGALRPLLGSLERASSLSNAMMLHVGAGKAQELQAEQYRERISSLAENLSSTLAASERELAARIGQLERELHELQETTASLRLTHARGLFVPLERAALATAEQLGKKIRFVESGGEMRVEAQLLASMRDPLLHVVRNAVAHGIELPSVRAMKGKPEFGMVSLSVERRGNSIAFTCKDDGAGVDLNRLRRSATEKGFLSGQEAREATNEELLQLLLRPGFTTERRVTQIAGRGIGLDAVAAVISDLRGEVRIATDKDKGTTVELITPAALLVTEVVFVDVGGQVAAIPAAAMRESLRVASKDLVAEYGSLRLGLRGMLLPYLSLARAMKKEFDPEQTHVAIVIEAAGRLIAVGVDRLLGTGTLVARPLPDFVRAEPFVSGVALDGEGVPQLILDPEGLAVAAIAQTVPAEARRAQPLPILVIDDSLTTRMLEQSILEAAGYRVEVAGSAEEALEKARLKSYGLFLVDVEMPGKNGFEFVELTRHDEHLQAVPAILVTSRNSDVDRARGRAAGARDYVVKSEFDQGYLLQRIRELVRSA